VCKRNKEPQHLDREVRYLNKRGGGVCYKWAV